MQLKDFSIDNVNQELTLKKPLMVRGDSDTSGHAWIMDGAKYIENPFNVDNTVTKTYYYHCVWGWGGYDNGYFIFENRAIGDRPMYRDLQYIANLQKNN